MRSTIPLTSLIGLLAVLSCRPPGQALPHIGRIDRLDSALDALLARDARIEKLADGFEWLEGPVWRKRTGELFFSDIPRNTIYSWAPDRGVRVFLRPAGYNGATPAGAELGTNGLIFDQQDRLVMADHGNRQVARLVDSTYTRVALADRFEGKRLNSPNDVAYHSSGDLYFTDPPYGLNGRNQSPVKELPFNGVYRLEPSGRLTLLVRELTYPNGIALSPDERTLYVAVSDPARPVIMAYDLTDGSASRGRVFFDAARLRAAGGKGLPDGLKVDRAGNLFATGPGGVLILSPQGRHLGTIHTGEATANCAWGDDGSTLYITADMMLVRVRTRTTGHRF